MTAREAMLFRPLRIKGVEFRNRIWVSPMCQYSSRDGHPTDWHLVHLGSRAAGGAGLVMVEATAVSSEGRISPDDSGIWSDSHVSGFKRISDFIRSQGSVAGIQLAHAGRKASTDVPWRGGRILGLESRGWQTIAPSALAFREGEPAPREMNREDMVKVVDDFAAATVRSLNAGFDVMELHMAHGYLMHQFLSPISNHRRDEYGGSLENRMRFPLEVARAIRAKWPADRPLFARISATDWSGPETPSWTLEDSVRLCLELKAIGFDLIDVSSGGTLARASIPATPGYQVPFARQIRTQAGIATAAVGLITEPAMAETILTGGAADAIFIAREFLRDPYWPYRAARELGVDLPRPPQYARA